MEESYYNVLVYNFSEKEIEFMKNNLPRKNYELTVVDDDIMEFVFGKYSIGIYNAITTPVEELSMIYNIHEESLSTSRTIVIVGNIDLPKKLKRKFKIFKNFEELKSKYELLILDSTKKVKKDYSHSRQLANSLVILTKILNNPGITTEELCFYCSDLSPRSIGRYIETLNVAGECIIKDKTTKGWKLGCDGESVLISDALLRKKEYSLYNTCDCCKECIDVEKMEEDWTSEYESTFKNDKLREFDENINNLNLIKHPSKTFLDVIDRKANDENLISDWLAFLFDNRVNGMKFNSTLDALLNAVGMMKTGILMEKIIDIRREFPIRIKKDTKEDKENCENRRIDLLIECCNFVIVIENKIDSWENNEQTNAYYEFVENCDRYEDKKKIYIYLKPDYNESHPLSEHFREVTYGKLLKEFSKIKSESYKNRELYKFHYLIEFLRVGASLVVDYNIDENVEFYNKNYSKWEIIRNEYIKNNDVLIENIINSITNHLGKAFQIKKASTYIQFYKSEWEKYGIHFEFISYDRFEILGKENVEMYMDLHLENAQNIETDIEPRSKRYVLNFSNNDEIDESIKSICRKLKAYDRIYTKRIDEDIIESFLKNEHKVL